MIRGLYTGIMRRCTLCEYCSDSQIRATLRVGRSAELMYRFVVDGAESELGILDLIQVGVIRHGCCLDYR
jgi:hypothetical protein